MRSILTLEYIFSRIASADWAPVMSTTMNWSLSTVAPRRTLWLMDDERVREFMAPPVNWSSGLGTRPGPFMDEVELADSGGLLGWLGGDVVGGKNPELKDACGEVLDIDGEGTEVALMGGSGGRARDGLDGVSRKTVRASRRGPVVSVGLVNARRAMR